jgi:hypothetical protein
MATTNETTVRVGPYIISEDGNGWKVERQTATPMRDRDGIEKPGQFVVQFVGYYGEWPSCLRMIVNDGYKGQGASDMKRMLARQDEMIALVAAAVRP